MVGWLVESFCLLIWYIENMLIYREWMLIIVTSRAHLYYIWYSSPSSTHLSHILINWKLSASNFSSQAAVFNHTEIAFALMEHGAHLDCKNAQGKWFQQVWCFPVWFSGKSTIIWIMHIYCSRERSIVIVVISCARYDSLSHLFILSSLNLIRISVLEWENSVLGSAH